MRVENKTVALRPVFLVLAVWLPIFALLALEPQIELTIGQRVSQKTAIINICGVVAILAGIMLSRLTLSDHQTSQRDQTWGRRADFIALLCILLVSFVGAYFGVLAWRELGVDPLALTERTLYEMNLAYSQEERVTSGLTGRLTTMSLIGLLYSLFLLLEKRLNATAAVTFGLLFILAMASPRRAMLLTALLSAIMMWFLAQKSINPWRAAKFLAVFMAIVSIFGFTQFLLQKAESYSILNTIWITSEYYITSFYVMDQLVNSSHFEQTYIVLSVPERIVANFLGYNPNVDLQVPFVYVPKAANTVPAFYYFYKSGGYLGVVASGLVIGWIFLRLYSEMKLAPSLFNTIASSLFAAGIVLSPRQCLFIEYDFFFLLVAALAMNALRKSRWLRRRSKWDRASPVSLQSRM